MMGSPPTHSPIDTAHEAPGDASTNAKLSERGAAERQPVCSDRAIRFWHRGEIQTLGDVHPTRSTLDWLRDDARCTGTKEGCNEGDCGACTVVLGELDAQAVGGLKLQAINACTRFVPTLDGKALFTVQDLAAMGGADPALHPVQQAMVNCHGSQCGFCTPGFVMTLWEMYERRLDAGSSPTRQESADALAGNLCRCTGYRPILDAAEQMFQLPAQRLDRAPVVAALKSLAEQPALSYTATNPHRLDAQGRNRQDRYWAPTDLHELAALRLAHPQARLLAGSTDIGLWVNKQFRDLGDIIYLGEVAALRSIASSADQLVIGAGASLEDAWAALGQVWPSLRDVWLRFASPPVRQAGTMGGNVANGSPIGDSAPVLMALDAQLLLRCGNRTRRLPLASFYTGYMRNQLDAGEWVQAIEVPLPVPAGQRAVELRAYKISKRFDSDISALCAGLAVGLDEAGRVEHIRIALGGMAATVARASLTEQALLGHPWDETAIESAVPLLAQDYTPLTDMRATAGYRLRVAQNLLRRFWLETRLHERLPEAEVNVWRQAPVT